MDGSGFSMIAAFLLALRQLTDRPVLRVLARSLALSLALFAAIGAASWWALDALLERFGLDARAFTGAEGLRGLAALIAVLIGGWLLWRIIAIAVLQFFADDVVTAVEARHYPDAHERARPLGLRAEITNGLRGAMRALAWNLTVLPFAIALFVTGFGTALLFWAVNAVLMGRELTDLVWLRHRSDPAEASPLGAGERFALGGITAALFFVPLVNLLAPVIGAAMAAHLVHRKGVTVHAP